MQNYDEFEHGTIGLSQCRPARQQLDPALKFFALVICEMIGATWFRGGVFFRLFFYCAAGARSASNKMQIFGISGRSSHVRESPFPVPYRAKCYVERP